MTFLSSTWSTNTFKTFCRHSYCMKICNIFHIAYALSSISVYPVKSEMLSACRQNCSPHRQVWRSMAVVIAQLASTHSLLSVELMFEFYETALRSSVTLRLLQTKNEHVSSLVMCTQNGYETKTRY